MSQAVDLSGAEDRALEAARRGDISAFNELVLKYQTVVYNVSLRTLGNQDDAADATQEAFISAFRHLADFRGGSFKAWLLRIAVNACYDILRRRQRRPSSSLDELAEHDDGDVGPGDTRPGPERSALNAETAAVIQAGLNTLPEEQRILVVLCDVQGLSYEEAAESCQIALGTVKSRLSRARARLRDYLAQRGELPGDFRRPNE
jgi:RNA polymerase sigma-70 factor (ECF subfamily)